MAVLTVQNVSQAGLNATLAAAGAGGDSFANDGKTMFRVKNGGGSSITVTVDSVAQCSFGEDHDLAVTVAAGADMLIGPFHQLRFNDSDGRVAVSYSGVTSVTVAAIKFTPAPN